MFLRFYLLNNFHNSSQLEALREYKVLVEQINDYFSYYLGVASENAEKVKNAELQSTAENSEQKNNTTENGGVKYSLRMDARDEVKKALNDKFYKGEIKLTDNSPSILIAQKGVRNLPMLMKTSHIRENILTEDEAENKGYKVNKNINYHGLGEELFFDVIDGLDDVKEAYRGTQKADNPSRRENYSLLISQYKDKQGNIINVPVYVNEKGLYNQMFIDTNKVATVFGKNELRDYINREIKKGNLVRTKNRSNQVSESTSPINADYEVATSTNSISNSQQNVNENKEKSEKTDVEKEKSVKSLKLSADAKKVLEENPELKSAFLYLQSQFKLVKNYVPSEEQLMNYIKTLQT